MNKKDKIVLMPENLNRGLKHFTNNSGNNRQGTLNTKIIMIILSFAMISFIAGTIIIFY